MWSKSAFFLMVKVKTQRGRGFTFPIPLWVIDDWFEAISQILLRDLSRFKGLDVVEVEAAGNIRVKVYLR